MKHSNTTRGVENLELILRLESAFIFRNLKFQISLSFKLSVLSETDIAKISKKQRKQWRRKGQIPIFRKALLNQQTIKLPRNKT